MPPWLAKEGGHFHRHDGGDLNRRLHQRDGKRMRVLERAPKGGVRIDGGDGGFASRTVSLNDIAGNPIDRHVVFGQVLGVHIDDRFIANGRLDTAAMRPIARCGYDEYAVVDEVFRMVRPSVPEAALAPRLAEPMGRRSRRP